LTAGTTGISKTQQDTITTVIQEKWFSGRYRQLRICITRKRKPLHDIYSTRNEQKVKRPVFSRRLERTGFGVSVGSMVWNQHKDSLTDDETKTRLIYSSDIESGTLIKKYANTAKRIT
jgi:hypothetical protein